MATGEQQWNAGQPSDPPLHQAAARLGRLEQLDPAAKKMAKKVRDVIPHGPVKDALSGTFLGHALHPLLTDIPIGAWTSAIVLDLIGGRESQKAAQRLVGVGLAAVPITVATGYSDWADSEVANDSVRRIGFLHAGANALAAGLFGASWAARRGGRRGRGVTLGLAGGAVVTFGGYLGGHMSYSQGVGVDQTAFEQPPRDWTPTVSEAEVREGEAHRADAGGVAVLLSRHQGRITAIADRCTHRGGPLSDGHIEDGCVHCPWHHSVFRLVDGSVVEGPATAPQPAFDVRVRDGQVEVRAASMPTG